MDQFWPPPQKKKSKLLNFFEPLPKVGQDLTTHLEAVKRWGLCSPRCQGDRDDILLLLSQEINDLSIC